MNYIFFGTPRFAAIILGKLIERGFAPVAIVCNPDRPVGRKKIITAPAIKVLAEKYKIRVFQPENLTNYQLPFTNYRPDFAIVAAYAKILPKEIINLPKFGTIGAHPSLLPKYRGATPIQSVILNGEAETGVTLYQIDEKVDHGAILATSQQPLATSETYLSLEQKLAEIAGDLIIETMPKFLKGAIKPQTQKENQATFTKKFVTQDGFIDPEILRQAQNDNYQAAVNIDSKIRALNPEPGVWTYERIGQGTRNKGQGEIKNKRIKLLEAEIIEGKLRLKLTQRDGEKPRKPL